MKKPLLAITSLTALIALIYVGGVFYVDSRLQAELDNYEAALTASSEIIVHHFEYESEFRTGQLYYDLEWMPTRGSAWYQAATMYRGFSEEGLRVAGSIEFVKGPWVGGTDPWALARMDLNIPLPDEQRRNLPQYPGETPVLTITSVLELDGSVLTRLVGVEYQGIYTGAEPIENAVLSGLHGSLSLDSSMTSGTGNFSLGEFSLAFGEGSVAIENLTVAVQMEQPGPGVTLDFRVGSFEVNSLVDAANVRLDNLHVTGASQRLEPGLWLGTTNYGLEGFNSLIDGVAVRVVSLQGDSVNQLDSAGRVEATNKILISRFELGNGGVSDIAFDLSLRNLNRQAYVDLVLFSSQMDPLGDDAEAYLESLLATINTALADGPSMNIDRAAVSVINPQDITGSMSLSYGGPVPLNLDQPDEIFAGVVLRGELSIALAAARRLTELGLSNMDPTLTGAAFDAAVDDNYQQLLATLSESEFVTVGAEAITSSLDITNGNVTFSGSTIMTIDDLLGLLSGPEIDDTFDGYSSAVSPPAQMPLIPADPRYENVVLTSGFTPDPYTVSILAGGVQPVLTALGVDCPGSLSSNQPDVILSYTAGPDYALSLYAETTDTDLTLVVLTPDGWHCDDDSYGDFNPGLTFESPVSGDYLIWVGTYEEGVTSAELGISEY